MTVTDWEPMLSLKARLLPIDKAITTKETNKYWLADMCRKPMWYDQFDEMYQNWKDAKTDKEKTEIWRNANRLLLEREKFQIEYNGMSEASKKAKRLAFEMRNSSFERAMELAPQCLQTIQDEYYMVPLFVDKAQYVLRPNITGLMVYKFSWGPQVFNLKYVNVK